MQHGILPALPPPIHPLSCAGPMPAQPPPPPSHPYASRGGLKLEAALQAFALDPAGWWAADLGCSTGGFVSCWLHHGAAKVAAVDTAYGELAWKLRQDPRVLVLERRNALHVPIPPEVAARGGVDGVSVDLGWTKQDKALPAALRWLAPGGVILSLVKPHYERPTEVSHARQREREVETLADDEAEAISRRVMAEVPPALGLRCDGLIPCPIKGGKGGNLEFMALLRRV